LSAGASRYSARIDLSWVNDAHVLAIGRVPHRSRVLDLGCADGSVAATLRRMGCRVWGVERDPDDAEAARSWCESVLEADLETVDLAASFAGQEFDVVLMLDVLEHLADPTRLLFQAGRVLDRVGWGVISLPNVAHLSTRLALLDGQFRYRDTGLLDRTHLRFFDRQGVEGLLDAAGWAAFDWEAVTRGLGESEIDPRGLDLELAAKLETEPDALSYQFVVTAAPTGWPAAIDPPLLPAAVTQRQLLDAQRQLREARPVPNLVARLESMRRSSLDRRSHLRSLLEALEENTERLRRGVSG
jgi:2-polyprenyl-3-methyl-5-hydroxy-6-metoxy-1,4-benzoquinol methylase